MGHRDHTTTLIYADYAPDPSQGAVWAARAFAGRSQGADSAADLDGPSAGPADSFAMLGGRAKMDTGR